MDRERECGCKGRRSCLWCEEQYNILPDFILSKEKRSQSYVYCCACDCLWPGWEPSLRNQHPHHVGQSLPFPGIQVVENFLSETEAALLLDGIDNEPWDVSQSGRRKQNYGPKCNFRKKKLSLGTFKGFPKFSLFVQKKLHSIPILRDYFVIEQCSLEYDPVKGACIDPHIDDCWIWGERIVTVNVLGNSVLTLVPFKCQNSKKYNLDMVQEYLEESKMQLPFSHDVIVRIPMPERSLIIMHGQARYKWEHCVLREDISTRRVCLAYRDFTPPYLKGGKHEEDGRQILETSMRSVGFLY